MIRKTFTARYGRIRSMLRGLKNHPGRFDKYGATPVFLNKLTGLYVEVGRIQKRRRDIKEKSIAATADKNRNLKEAEKLCSKARKWVRRELPAQAWPVFGFFKGEYAKPNPGLKFLALIKGK